MRIGYNTNSLAHHDLVQAIELLAEMGYRSVAITVDHGALNPYADPFSKQVEEVQSRLDRYGLGTVIETGARFLLDPRTKHEPTLLTADPTARGRRIDFLCRCVRLARRLGSDCVSCWSGVLRDAIAPEAAFDRLCEALRPVLDEAARQGQVVGFEPEPGMFIDTMDRYSELVDRIGDPHLALTLDLGHLQCLGEIPIADQIRRWAARLVNVHADDMRSGVHEHLMFGEGEIDFPPIIEALHQAGYSRGLHVELSRHSHDGPAAAEQAYQFLEPLLRFS